MFFRLTIVARRLRFFELAHKCLIYPGGGGGDDIYLHVSQCRATKARTRLRTNADAPEPSLLAYTEYG